MNNSSESFDLSAIARRAMIDAGFVLDFPQLFLDGLHTLEGTGQVSLADLSARDLRSLLWSSIDDQKSRDLDQVEYAERLPNGDVRILVGIEDVDALVHKGSEMLVFSQL